jgi:hypothetical protein
VLLLMQPHHFSHMQLGCERSRHWLATSCGFLGGCNQRRDSDPHPAAGHQGVTRDVDVTPKTSLSLRDDAHSSGEPLDHATAPHGSDDPG